MSHLDRTQGRLRECQPPTHIRLKRRLTFTFGIKGVKINSPTVEKKMIIIIFYIYLFLFGNGKCTVHVQSFLYIGDIFILWSLLKFYFSYHFGWDRELEQKLQLIKMKERFLMVRSV